MPTLISDKYAEWEREAEERFQTLKRNEEELNRIFIDIYGLQDELTPEVEDKDVTTRRADLGREIRSLISYAVGCMFGRYSLDVDGLAYAGGNFSEKWVVVSGKYYLKEVVAGYVRKELSRVGCLAEGDGHSGGDICAGEEITARGTVRVVGTNAPGGGVDSVEHSGGAVSEFDKGIRSISCYSARIKIGTGNTIIDLCASEILDAIRNRNGDEFVGRGWANADRIDWKTIHYSLTTAHYGVDADNAVPICDDEYFEDDIVARFVDFIKAVYGADTLEENLRFIASALTPNPYPLTPALGTAARSAATPRAVIRKYFLNDFYTDHCKVYQKRPIYWLFDSGKKNGFKALIYLHRYSRDLLAKLRTDYVHEQQERYRTQLKHIADALNTAVGAERAKLSKRQDKLTEQLREITVFEEKVHHLADMNIEIDLDDGVKVNYAKFADVLAQI
jgi:hypothetical protein